MTSAELTKIATKIQDRISSIDFDVQCPQYLHKGYTKPEFADEINSFNIGEEYSRCITDCPDSKEFAQFVLGVFANVQKFINTDQGLSVDATIDRHKCVKKFYDACVSSLDHLEVQLLKGTIKKKTIEKPVKPVKSQKQNDDAIPKKTTKASKVASSVKASVKKVEQQQVSDDEQVSESAKIVLRVKNSASNESRENKTTARCITHVQKEQYASDEDQQIEKPSDEECEKQSDEECKKIPMKKVAKK